MSKQRAWLRLVPKLSSLGADYGTQIGYKFPASASNYILGDAYILYGIGIASAMIIAVSMQFVPALRALRAYMLARVRRNILCELSFGLWCSKDPAAGVAKDEPETKETRGNIYKTSIEE